MTTELITKNGPALTIIMPVKNVAAWISEAIRSIDLIESGEIEILCVDDISSDDTIKTIESIGDPRIRVAPNRGSGVANARNTGVAEARGRYIGYLDGDDRFVPGALASMVKALEAAPSFGAVVGHCRIIDEQGSLLVDAAPDIGGFDVTELLKARQFYHISQFIFRRSVFEEIIFARAFFAYGEDIDFLLRFSENNRAYCVPIVVSELRSRRTSVTRTAKAALMNWYKQQAYAFQEQRLTTGTDPLMRGEAPMVPLNLPPANSNKTSAFEARILLGAAWRDYRCGNIRSTLVYIRRILLVPSRLYYAKGLPRLIAVIIRDIIRRRSRLVD